MMSNGLRKMAFVFALVIGGGILYAADPPKSADVNSLPRPIRAKQLLGASINIQNNTAVGTVDDIVLSEVGEVEYLVVKTADNRLVSVPWSAAVWGKDYKAASVNITQEQFKTVPTYTATEYPQYFIPTYRDETYKYYGLTPGQLRRLNRRLP